MGQPLDPSLDPWRLCCAAHELGHAIVWTGAGLPIAEICVTGRGANVEGYTQLGKYRMRDQDQALLFQVGLMAGWAAGDLWARHHPAVTQPRSANAHDDRAFRRYQRQALWVRGYSMREARHEAARLARAAWPQIARLAPRLAQRGTVML